MRDVIAAAQHLQNTQDDGIAPRGIGAVLEGEINLEARQEPFAVGTESEATAQGMAFGGHPHGLGEGR